MFACVSWVGCSTCLCVIDEDAYANVYNCDGRDVGDGRSDKIIKQNAITSRTIDREKQMLYTTNGKPLGGIGNLLGARYSRLSGVRALQNEKQYCAADTTRPNTPGKTLSVVPLAERVDARLCVGVCVCVLFICVSVFVCSLMFDLSPNHFVHFTKIMITFARILWGETRSYLPPPPILRVARVHKSAIRLGAYMGEDGGGVFGECVLATLCVRVFGCACVNRVFVGRRSLRKRWRKISLYICNGWAAGKLCKL